MATTPNLAMHYPALTDSPNVPRDIKALADDVDTKMQFLPVSSTSQVTNPYDGQIVYNLTDTLCYQYHASVSSWWKFIAYARYELQNGTTQMNVRTDTLMQFPTAVATDPRVVPAGGGNTSFLLQPGRWKISAGARLLSAGGALISLGTGTTANEANAFVSGSNPSTLFNPSVSTTIEFTTPTSVCAFIWSDIANFTCPGSGSAPFPLPHMTHISFERSI